MKKKKFKDIISLVEKHIFKKNSIEFKELDSYCFLSKNLYNTALFHIRKHYSETKKYLFYKELYNLLSSTKNSNYYALPAQCAQQILKLLDNSYSAFFALLKLKAQGLYNEKVSPPHYLEKDGRFSLVFTTQGISKNHLENSYLKFYKINNTPIKIINKNLSQVRVTHRGNHIVLEVIYNKTIQKHIHNDRYCAIDLGINNLATITSNVIKPIIINGRPLKSINQFYNKKLSEKKSSLELSQGRKTSNKIRSLTLKRNNKISDYLHKSSKYIINHLVSNNISTLVIGKNKLWKQEVNIGKKNNQNFVSIPHSKFIDMLSYKAKLVGIKVIITEESYSLISYGILFPYIFIRFYPYRLY